MLPWPVFSLPLPLLALVAISHFYCWVLFLHTLSSLIAGVRNNLRAVWYVLSVVFGVLVAVLLFVKSSLLVVG